MAAMEREMNAAPAPKAPGQAPRAEPGEAREPR